MDIPLSKGEIISRVKKDPASPFFLILTQLLIDENKLEEALEICNAGLAHHPESIEGNFLKVKILCREENYIEAEKLLKFVINRHGAHINGLKLMGKVQRSLNRSSNTIKVTLDKILELNPNDPDVLQWQEENIQEDISSNETIEKTEKQSGKPVKDLEDEWEKVIPISMRMATLTLAEVYKTQGYYLQAKEVLKMVEKKGGDRWRIRKMRGQLDKLIQLQTSEKAEA